MFKLKLNNLDVSKYAIGKSSQYNCFEIGNNLSEALVYGNISVTKIKNNTFLISNDIYDFDIQWNNVISFRNFATAIGALINGKGNSFPIHFNGLWIKK